MIFQLPAFVSSECAYTEWATNDTLDLKSSIIARKMRFNVQIILIIFAIMSFSNLNLDYFFNIVLTNIAVLYHS